jgi:hypothetical protein
MTRSLLRRLRSIEADRVPVGCEILLNYHGEPEDQFIADHIARSPNDANKRFTVLCGVACRL